MKINDILKPVFIKLPLNSSTKSDSIKELLELLNHNDIIRNQEKVLNAVFEREKIMSTGVGNGVAIPHCKHADCKEFAIALGIHKEGIEFDAIDKKPAKIIFLLIGPEDQPGTHIRLLSRISRIISKEDVRQKVLKCENPKQLHDLLSDEESKLFGKN
jgi:fructose-specific phosphotransferase system IIA component